MELAVFAITAAVALTGAVAMVLSKNAVHSALFLLLNFSAIAVLYLLLRAPFLFAIQLIVYAGAIIVLFLFVVMLLGAERHEEGADALGWQQPTALVMGIGLLAALLVVALSGPLGAPAGVAEGYGAPEAIARALFTDALLPFQVTAMLILAAIVGVVVLHLREQQRG
jgi:NADH-quinone oxidoreductase subunit J